MKKVIKKKLRQLTHLIARAKSKITAVPKAKHSVEAQSTHANLHHEDLQTFILLTMRYFLEQTVALAKVLEAVCLDPPTRNIGKKLVYIAVHDVLPLAGLQYLTQLIQASGDAFIEENPHSIGGKISIQLVVGLLSVGTLALAIRKAAKRLVVGPVMMGELATALRPAKDSLTDIPCILEECSKLRHLQGSLRGLIGYETTVVVLHLINFLPYVGAPLSLGLKIYHEARYPVIAMMAIKGLCNRHQAEYIREYPALILSFAFMQLTLVALGSYFFEMTTGIPRVFYQSSFQACVFLLQINMAAQMRLPVPVSKSNRKLLDPIALYLGLHGFLFDTFMLGLKGTIPRLLKEPGNFNWEQWGARLIQISKHPATQKIKWVLLPRMLQNQRAFMHDPLIPWEPISGQVDNVYNRLIKIKNSWPFAVASTCPQLMRLSSFFGFPISVDVLQFAVDSLNSPNFHSQLDKLRAQLLSPPEKKMLEPRTIIYNNDLSSLNTANLIKRHVQDQQIAGTTHQEEQMEKKIQPVESKRIDENKEGKQVFIMPDYWLNPTPSDPEQSISHAQRPGAIKHQEEQMEKKPQPVESEGKRIDQNKERKQVLIMPDYWLNSKPSHPEQSIPHAQTSMREDSQKSRQVSSSFFNFKPKKQNPFLSECKKMPIETPTNPLVGAKKEIRPNPFTARQGNTLFNQQTTVNQGAKSSSGTQVLFGNSHKSAMQH